MRSQLTDTALAAILVASGWSIAGLFALAQDARSVVQPVVPPVCIILHASLTAPYGIAPQDEIWVDTQRIQMSIDHCGRGKAVELSSDGVHTAFLSGTVRLRRGVTLLVDKDVTLYGSRNPRDYDVHYGSCGQVNDSTRKGCRALIEADRSKNSGVMGAGVIDGRGGAGLLVDGTEQDVSWRMLAEEAHLWGHQQVPRLIDTDHTNNFTVSGVTLKNAAGVHLGFHKGSGLTVWGVKIDTPRDVRDADGIVPSAAKNITVADSYVRSGSNDMSIESGNGSIRNVSVIRNRFYWGHGIAIGSETSGGVRSVWVNDVSLDAPDKGILIQSNSPRGGTVKDVTYEDVCIRRSKSPILVDTLYGNPSQIPARNPVYQDIVLRNVRVSGGGKLQLRGVDVSHHIGIQFDGVMLTDPDAPYLLSSTHADIVQGPGPVNFLLLGEDSSISGRLGGNSPLDSCNAKFVPFPVAPMLVASTGHAPELLAQEPAVPPSGSKAVPEQQRHIQADGPELVPVVHSRPAAATVAGVEPNALIAPHTVPTLGLSATEQLLAHVACARAACHPAGVHRVVGRYRRVQHCRAGASCRSLHRHPRVMHRRVAHRGRRHTIRRPISQ